MKRITAAKLKKAAELAKSQGVRVRIGDYVIDPPGAANDAAVDADELQKKLDAMGTRR